MSIQKVISCHSCTINRSCMHLTLPAGSKADLILALVATYGHYFTSYKGGHGLRIGAMQEPLHTPFDTFFTTHQRMVA